MGALEPWHLVIILFVILLLFGAKRLPELARSLGSSARELKKGLKEDETPEQVKAAPAEKAPVIEASAEDVTHQPTPPQGT
jgi:sec-independent protein translocase protein TatA